MKEAISLTNGVYRAAMPGGAGREQFLTRKHHSRGQAMSGTARFIHDFAVDQTWGGALLCTPQDKYLREVYDGLGCRPPPSGSSTTR